MAAVRIFVLLVVLCVVTSILAQSEPDNRRYPRYREQLRRFQQRRRKIRPASGKSNFNQIVISGKKETKKENELVSEFQTKYEVHKDIEYTAHGVGENLDNMSPGARSKHGCMTLMKRSNEGRYHKMSYKLMESSCNMYMEWGKSMTKKNKWQPTDGQKAWLNSLGVDEKLKQMYAHAHDRRTPRQSGSGRAVRKEVRMMADRERTDFLDAVRGLKNTYMDGSSKYDLFVNFHQANAAPSAHFGPGFLGYHRELLLRQRPASRWGWYGGPQISHPHMPGPWTGFSTRRSSYGPYPRDISYHQNHMQQFKAY